MDKVWILTSGQYSEYMIEGVFSTEEKAREAGKAMFDSEVTGANIDVLFRDDSDKE